MNIPEIYLAPEGVSRGKEMISVSEKTRGDAENSKGKKWAKT